MMTAFQRAQEHNIDLSPELEDLLSRALGQITRTYRYAKAPREIFMAILSKKGEVGRALRLMHRIDFLGRYVPEFGRLTCLVQHEFYHRYTADEHTLVCLEQLDRIWEADKPPHSNYSEIFRTVERPFVLYLALLLHDAGKAARARSHSEIGGRLALNVARRLGLDGATTHTLRLIIEHHLTMSRISQRRDLDDPSVIRNFAAQIQNAENLKLLTLHTVADTLGTSDKLWNGFKDSLLLLLFHKTLTQFTGATAFIRAEEKQRELLADEVRRLLPGTTHEEEAQAHFASLPPRYFQIHSAKDIASDLMLAHLFMRRQLEEEE